MKRLLHGSRRWLALWVLLGVFLWLGVRPAYAETQLPNTSITTEVRWELAGSPYIVTGDVQVWGAGKLIIEPGVVVKFNQGSQMLVSQGGTLIAQGTAAQPIVFTSSAPTPQPGDWGYIYVGANSAARLAHCEISYGGRQEWWAQLYIQDTNDVSVENCQIRDGATDGIRLYQTVEVLRPILRNVTIENNAINAIHTSHVRAQPVYDNVVLRNNGADGVALGWGNNDTLNTHLTFDSKGINGAPFIFNGLSISAGSVVTVTPGTEMQFVKKTGPWIYDGGRLYAHGTPTQPITFTAYTAPDATPTPGDWDGIVVWREGGSLDLAYCDVSYGGRSAANIYSVGRDVRVNHCRIHHSSLEGVRTTNNQIHPLTFNTITDNAGCGVINMPSQHQQQVIFRNNVIANNGNGIVANAGCGILNQYIVGVDARRNWWGDPSGPQHPTLNSNGKGGTVSDLVLFDPWLNSVPGSVVFEPSQGGNVGTTTVRFWGVPADSAWQIVLRRAGQADIPGVFQGPALDDGVDYTFSLAGAAPTTGQFVASGPDAQPIPGAFTIIPAPSDARLQASERISVTVNGRTLARVGQPIPVFVNFTNNGLVDAPPTEFKVYGEAGLAIRPSPIASYVASVPSGVWGAAFDGVSYGSLATFMVPALRPLSTSFVPVVFVPPARGVYRFRIEYLATDAFAPIFQELRDPSLQYSTTLQSATDTKLVANFAVSGQDVNGGGTITFERQGPTAYFTPTVQVVENGDNLSYILTAAVPAGAVGGALSAAGADANTFEQVQQVIDLSKALAGKLRNTYSRLDEAEKLHARRLLMLGCLTEAGILNPNVFADKLRLEQLNNLGDLGKVSTALTAVLTETPYGSKFSMLLGEADAALNGLWAASLTADLGNRLKRGEFQELGKILAKYKGVPYEANAFTVITPEDLQQALDEYCYKRAPKQVRVVTGVIEAHDPNDKTGNAGVGPRHYVYPDEVLSYDIGYENIATATAPAAQVVISDTLDSSKLDLSTIRLGMYSFGERMVTAGAGTLPLFEELDLRPASNQIVRVEADLFGDTLVWRLTSIDPATGQIPEDPLIGFLPPNKNGTEGQGYVYFTIEPKPGLKKGDVIRNKATIVFDSNPPIDTPEWSNVVWNGPELYLPLLRK